MDSSLDYVLGPEIDITKPEVVPPVDPDIPGVPARVGFVFGDVPYDGDAIVSAKLDPAGDPAGQKPNGVYVVAVPIALYPSDPATLTPEWYIETSGAPKNNVGLDPASNPGEISIHVEGIAFGGSKLRLIATYTKV